MIEGQKQPSRRSPYWHPMVRAYNLSVADCEYLSWLVSVYDTAPNCDDHDILRSEVRASKDGDIHRGEDKKAYERVKRQFNVKTYDELLLFARWLCTGDCPIIDGSETLIATCQARPHGCEMTHSIAMFPFWPLDKRCSACIHRSTHRLPSGDVITSARKAAANIQALGRPNAPSATKASEVAAELSRLAGGAKGFAEELWATFERLRDDPTKNKTKTFLDLQMGIFRILLHIEEMRREARPMDDMTDEELSEHFRDIVLERMTEEQREIFNEAFSQAERLEHGSAKAEFGS